MSASLQPTKTTVSLFRMGAIVLQVAQERPDMIRSMVATILFGWSAEPCIFATKRPGRAVGCERADFAAGLSPISGSYRPRVGENGSQRGCPPVAELAGPASARKSGDVGGTRYKTP